MVTRSSNVATNQIVASSLAGLAAIARKGDDEIWRPRLIRAWADVQMAKETPDLRAAHGRSIQMCQFQTHAQQQMMSY
jgi:hypothetical protein